jgi:hypothetical protein
MAGAATRIQSRGAFLAILSAIAFPKWCAWSWCQCDDCRDPQRRWLAFLWRPLLRDPDDDMVMEAAVNGQADLLVTFKRRDFGVVGERFGIRVCSPGEAIRDLEQSA